MTTDQDADRELDRVARRLHAEAVAHVPGRTLLQLQTRRKARMPMRTQRPRALGWGLGAALAAMFAVVIGVRMETPAPAPANGIAAVGQADGMENPVDPAALDGLQDAFASLDEDPDLYLWLASADAQPLAME